MMDRPDEYRPVLAHKDHVCSGERRRLTVAEEILKMVNITKRFAGITALDRVQFSCSKGEVHVLAGENWGRKEYHT